MSLLSEWLKGLDLKRSFNRELDRHKPKAKAAIDASLVRLLSRVDTNADGRILDDEVQAVIWQELVNARVPDKFLYPLEIAISVGIIPIDGIGEKAKTALTKMAESIKRRIDGARF